MQLERVVIARRELRNVRPLHTKIVCVTRCVQRASDAGIQISPKCSDYRIYEICIWHRQWNITRRTAIRTIGTAIVKRQKSIGIDEYARVRVCVESKGKREIERRGRLIVAQC